MRDSSFLLLSYCAQPAAAREGRPQAFGCLHCALRAILVLAVSRAGASSPRSQPADAPWPARRAASTTQGPAPRRRRRLLSLSLCPIGFIPRGPTLAPTPVRAV